MSTPPRDLSDLGDPRKLFDGVRTGRRQRDLADAGEVFLLAREIARGDALRATLVSIEELRAVAMLATLTSECLLRRARETHAP